jgi:hypothetical protein
MSEARPKGWSSMVCVLLERLNQDQPDDTESAAEISVDLSGDAL